MVESVRDIQITFVSLLGRKPLLYEALMAYDPVLGIGVINNSEPVNVRPPFMHALFNELKKLARKGGSSADVVALYSDNPVVIAYDIEAQSKKNSGHKNKKTYGSFFSGLPRNNSQWVHVQGFPGFSLDDEVFVQVLHPGYLIMLKQGRARKPEEVLRGYLEQIKLDDALSESVGRDSWKYIIAVNDKDVQGYAYIPEDMINTLADEVVCLGSGQTLASMDVLKYS